MATLKDAQKLTEQIAEFEKQLEAVRAERDRIIAALAARHSVTRLANQLNVTRARVYQLIERSKKEPVA